MLIISGPTYFVASAAIDRNSNSSAVFKMLFNAGTKVHGASAPFLFSNDTTPPAGPMNAKISEIISSYYISFITTLDPNTRRQQDAIFWPSYWSGTNETQDSDEPKGFRILEITDNSIMISTDSDVGPECDFWGAHGLDISS